jgi:type IX secretion system PorP/SprF family membrane protein
MKKIFFLFIHIVLVFSLKAQHESQYTHFAFNRLAYNPAYAGSKEDLTVGGLYRHQWAGVTGAPRTLNAFLHTPFMNGRCGAGLSLYGDQIGATQTYTGALDYAYKIKMAGGTLSIGLRGELEHGTFDLTNANPADLVDNTIADAATNGTRNALNFGTGAYFSTSKYYIGLSVPRLLKNHLYKKFPTGRDVRSAYLTAGAVFPVSQNVKIVPSAMISYNASAPISYDLNVNAVFMNTFWLGGSVRLGDSFDALVQYQLSGQTRLGMSYDFTTSALRKNSKGSFEIMIEHTFCDCARDNVTNLRFF